MVIPIDKEAAVPNPGKNDNVPDITFAAAE